MHPGWVYFPPTVTTTVINLSLFSVSPSPFVTSRGSALSLSLFVFSSRPFHLCHSFGLFSRMQIDTLLFARQDDGCIKECPPPLPCACSANQECIVINRDCHTCSQTTCIAAPNTKKSSGGISKGALAGGIVAAVVLLALSISLYFWYRRKSRIRKILDKTREDKPAAAEDVLNRPDPIEKLPTSPAQQPAYPTPSQRVDIESRGTSLLPPPLRSQLVNPFDDSHSIQTTRTEGPNVIPIALISPESSLSYQSKTDTDSLPSSTSSGPVRPPRSPDLNLNLDHVNVSHDNLRVPYANSVISGISGISGASYSSDFLNEAPIIVTANTGAVRQVINVVKAEVVNPGAISPPSDGGLKPPSFSSRPANKSPLAATSFGPNDVLSETEEHEGLNPFDDAHSTTAQGSTSPAAKSFDQTTPRPDSNGSNWLPSVPTLPWSRSDDSRPSSISTQAGSVVNIGSATRVNLGLSSIASPATASTLPPTPYRNTMGRLVSPTTGGSSQLGTLQEQQARAFAQAHHGNKRVSGSSVISAASTRADSILEAFPFVPPSPISDRPIRSPPVSPLGKQSFTSGPKSPFVQPTVTVAPASPLNQQAFRAPSGTVDGAALPAPPSRQTLGLSTGSQLSTASTGLGSFPFQIDSGATSDANSNNHNSRPNTLSIRQRASLDTLALTSDLASYPLDFERDSMAPPPSR